MSIAINSYAGYNNGDTWQTGLTDPFNNSGGTLMLAMAYANVSYDPWVVSQFSYGGVPFTVDTPVYNTTDGDPFGFRNELFIAGHIVNPPTGLNDFTINTSSGYTDYWDFGYKIITLTGVNLSHFTDFQTTYAYMPAGPGHPIAGPSVFLKTKTKDFGGKGIIMSAMFDFGYMEFNNSEYSGLEIYNVLQQPGGSTQYYAALDTFYVNSMETYPTAPPYNYNNGYLIAAYSDNNPDPGLNSPTSAHLACWSLTPDNRSKNGSFSQFFGI